jgi:L,D-transpeptidase YcbB
VGSSSRTVLTLFAAAPISFMLLCAPSHAAEPDALAAPVGTEAVRKAVRNRLSEKFPSAGNVIRGALVDYYSVPEPGLLWVDEKGFSPRAKSVIEEIRKADDYGLRSADYDLPKSDGFDANNSTAANWLADAEIKISYAVLRYVRDARGGRLDPLRLSKNLDPTLALPDPGQVMEAIASRSEPAVYLRSFQPEQPQFEALRQKLIELRGGKSDDAEPVVKIPEGPVLKLGVEHEQVALLRKRLDVGSSAKHAVSVNEMMFDETVLEAVKQFQAEHGAFADGMVGPNTRRLLNQQPQQDNSQARMRLILLNMERWRWLPTDLGSFYVIVNVPEFMLRVMHEGEPVFSTRVVVGNSTTQTPIFSNEMQEIVFNPYWNVPNSIKTEEVLPYMRGGVDPLSGRRHWNTSVLRRNNLRVNIGGREVDPSRLDWDRIDIRNLNIYQPPGPDNILGNLKFVFPNKHDVYMHDTTQNFLFARPVRAESHGCMRVQDPDQLALMLLKHDQGWTAAEIASAIQNGYDQHVALKQKIPVYITYFTLWVNEDGSMSTFNDVYGHDARMAAALFGENVTPAPPSRAGESRVSRMPDRNRPRRSRDMSNGFAASVSGFISNF